MQDVSAIAAALCFLLPQLQERWLIRDRPLGAATEAFFQAAADRLAQLPPSDEPMEPSPLSPADLNGDGMVDAADSEIFEATLGTCSGSPSYDARADLNADTCVTFADQEIFDDLVAALRPAGPTRLGPSGERAVRCDLASSTVHAILGCRDSAGWPAYP
jgi:hypothetical protein